MEKYIPDIYQKSIYKINYDSLYNSGIRCLLIDLDNTIAPITIKEPNKKIKDLFNLLKEKGFKVIIFSNSRKNRVKPFKDSLDVECCYGAKKPFKKKYLKVLKDNNLEVDNVACIGDQLLTDIRGGNKVGITTILVNPIGTKEIFVTKINRMFEKRIFRKLRENDLFTKGKYYE